MFNALPVMANPQRIIDKAIKFLQSEREIYGSFSVDNILIDHISAKQKEPNKMISIDTIKQLEMIKTLNELEALCKTTVLLKTDLEEANLVMGIGNPNADLLLIGEAPGKQEDIQSEPFVGRSGQLLNKILKAINFEREDIYIANILKYRPPDNRDPRPDERLKSLPFLLKQIEIIKPKLILCLGRISAQTLLENSESMKNMRGRFHPFMDRYELMVTYHPAALLRNPNFKKRTWEDVQLLRKRYDELGCKP